MARKKYIKWVSIVALTAGLTFQAVGSEPDSDIVPDTALEAAEENPAPEAPVTEAPAAETLVTEAPVTEAPVTEAPVTEAPATEAPVTEAPVTEAPVTEAPVTEAPVTEAPATEAPATEAPVTEAPSTEAPSTELPHETDPPQTETPQQTEPQSEERPTEEPEETERVTEKETQPETPGETVVDEITVDRTEKKGVDAEELQQEQAEKSRVEYAAGSRAEEKQKTEEKKKADAKRRASFRSGVVSDSGLGELYIAVRGYPVGDLTKNEEKVYRFLREELGLNKAAASGVLSNMYFESSFSSVAVGDGGTSLGLCQWHASRCRTLMGWCKAHKYDYRSLEGQLEYLKYELTHGYASVLGFLYGVSDTPEGAYRAGYYFCMYFESPDSVQTRSDARGTYARNTYYPSDLDKSLDSTGKTGQKGKKTLKRFVK